MTHPYREEALEKYKAVVQGCSSVEEAYCELATFDELRAQPFAAFDAFVRELWAAELERDKADP